jgi:hypothetical protein
METADTAAVEGINRAGLETNRLKIAIIESAGPGKMCTRPAARITCLAIAEPYRAPLLAAHALVILRVPARPSPRPMTH